LEVRFEFFPAPAANPHPPEPALHPRLVAVAT
jgi:hypothetical protein